MKKITLLTFVLFSVISYAQVGINTNTPDTSSALDIESTTGGILIPRLTETQRDAISSPATGLMIYQTDQTTGFYFFNGIAWTRIEGVVGPQGETGPAGPQGDQGLAGPQGPAGPQGDQGLAGPQGPAGPQGDQGLAGPVGPAGPQGDQGLAGPVGPAGPQGDQGLAGPAGPQGDQGLAGPAGPQGPQGATGAAGTNGTNGSDGADGKGISSTVDNGDGTFTITYTDNTTFTTSDFTGPTGATGPQGPQGPQGIQGVAGADGTNGSDGADGSDGSSAYEIWVSAGNTGTESDFLASLVGAQGEQGIQGVQGETGPTGPQGPQGPQGIQGIQGVAGADGTNGSDGADGADGNGIASTTDNNDGTFTLTFDDGTTFTTSDLTGPQGPTSLTAGDGITISGSQISTDVKVAKFNWSNNYFNLSNSTENYIPWDTTVFNSNSSVYQLTNSGSTGTDCARILINETGYYELKALVFLYDMHSNVDVTVSAAKSTGSTGTMSLIELIFDGKFSESSSDRTLNSSTILSLSAGEYISISVNPSANGPYPASSSIGKTTLTLTKL